MSPELDVPIHTLVVSSGTGDGKSIDNSVGVTSGGQPNIVIKTITPVLVTVIRAAKVYIQSLLGLLTVGGAKPELLGAHDFMAAVTAAALLSIAPAGYSVLTSVLELLTELNQKYPRLSV